MSKGVFQKYIEIDRRYIYLLLFILISLPIIKPIGIPVRISEETRNFKSVIDTLDSGDSVLIIFNTARMDYPELGYPVLAAIRSFLTQDIQVLIACTNPQSPLTIRKDIENVARITDSTNGEDYVFYGYISGEEAAIASLADDLKSPQVDFYQNPLSGMSILENKNNVGDIDLVIVSHQNMDDAAWVVRQIYTNYGNTCLDVTTAGIYPTIAPYIEGGQFAGVLKGARYAAEFEQLIGYPGGSSSAIDSQVLIQGTFLILGTLYLISSQLQEVEK